MRYELLKNRIISAHAKDSDKQKHKKAYLNQDSGMIRFHAESDRLDHVTSNGEAA